MDGGVGGDSIREDGNYRGDRAWGGCLGWHIQTFPRGLEEVHEAMVF